MDAPSTVDLSSFQGQLHWNPPQTFSRRETVPRRHPAPISDHAHIAVIDCAGKNCQYEGMTPWSAHESTVPRKAAAGVLFDERRGEVLLVRRNPSLAFMGGHHAFPGGATDPGDARTPVDGVEDPESALRIATVVREVFEETGLLLTQGASPNLGALRAARRALHGGEISFATILERFNQKIKGSDFVPAGLWITPPFSPIRFDTQYFLHRYEGTRYEEVLESDSEIVELNWMRPEDGRRRWHEGAIRLSTPVAFVLLHLARLSIPEALPWLRKTPSPAMDARNRFEPRPGIHIIPQPVSTLPPATHVNCVVVGEDTLYVVDPGAAGETEQRHLEEHLDHFSALGGRVAAVLLTHGHCDHLGAAEFLRSAYGAPIWAHERAVPPNSVTLDRRLNDGEVLTLPGDPEWRIRCLYTPGHHPGHLCFFEESTRTLLCGDMAANPGTILISPDAGGDMTQYLHSLERLLAEDFHALIPAHGLPIAGDAAKEMIRNLIAHRLEREAKIKAALEAGARTTQELLERAYDDTPREVWPLAEQQLAAHLVRLGHSVESESEDTSPKPPHAQNKR